MNKDLKIIGKILKTHGLSGEFRVLPFSEDFFYYRNKPVFLLCSDDTKDLFRQEPYCIDYLKGSPGRPIVHLDSINHIESAQAIANFYLAVESDLLPPLETEEYYFSDLAGSSVVTDDGRPLGKVNEIYETSGHEVLSILHNNREYLVPFVKEWVLKVDIDNKCITINHRYFSDEED